MILFDISLLLMVTVCVLYCFILNRRIKDLHSSRIEFARMIKELNSSMTKAESSVKELTDLSSNVCNELKHSIQDADNAKSELKRVSAEYTKVINSLDNKEVSARAVKTAKAIKSKKAFEDRSLFNDDDLAADTFHTLHKTRIKKSSNLESVPYKGASHESAIEDSVNLNQSSYYDSLKKISIKK